MKSYLRPRPAETYLFYPWTQVRLVLYLRTQVISIIIHQLVVPKLGRSAISILKYSEQWQSWSLTRKHVRGSSTGKQNPEESCMTNTTKWFYSFYPENSEHFRDAGGKQKHAYNNNNNKNKHNQRHGMATDQTVTDTVVCIIIKSSNKRNRCGIPSAVISRFCLFPR